MSERNWVAGKLVAVAEECECGPITSVATLAQSHFLFERALWFSWVTRFSGFVLSKSLQPSFEVSHLFSWQVLMLGPMCRSLLCLVTLRILVLLVVPVVISAEWVTAQLMHNAKSSDIYCYPSRVDSQISTTTSRPSVKPWELSPPENVEQIVNTLVAEMALFAAMQQNVSTLAQNVSSLTARMCKIFTNATSASGGSGSASSWNVLGHGDGSTATGPLGSHGPGSSDDNRSTRRRLDTFF